MRISIYSASVRYTDKLCLIYYVHCMQIQAAQIISAITKKKKYAPKSIHIHMLKYHHLQYMTLTQSHRLHINLGTPTKAAVSHGLIYLNSFFYKKTNRILSRKTFAYNNIIIIVAVCLCKPQIASFACTGLYLLYNRPLAIAVLI